MAASASTWYPGTQTSPEAWSATMPGRSASVARTTKETSIEVTIDLDGSGVTDVQTPLPFLTHMVEQIGKHGLFDLRVRAKGDVEIDGHLGSVAVHASSPAP